MKNTKGRMNRLLVVNVLAIAMLAASIVPASAGMKAQKVIASIHGISHVSLRTSTTNYLWVRFRTSSGTGKPVKAVVHVRCGGGRRKTVRWSDDDGASSRVVHIRPGQGKCHEGFNAWTDAGARIGIAVSVKR